MKFSKNTIRDMVSVYGKPQFMPCDDFNALSVRMENVIREDTPQDCYYRSKYSLIYEQLVTHRMQETEAVKDNVAKSIHDSLYRDIIVNLSQIRHESHRADRDEIVQMLTKLIDRLEE